MCGSRVQDGETETETELQRAEREARRYWPKGAEVVQRVIRAHKLCEEGQRIAWESARLVQRAMDRAVGEAIDDMEGRQ